MRCHSFWAMNFTDFVSAGVTVLADFDRDVAMATGLSSGRVRDLARVHHTYFGPTQFTRKQRDALAAAEGLPCLLYTSPSPRD